MVAAPSAGDLDTADHWKGELERTGAIGWRVSHANEMYQMCRRWVLGVSEMYGMCQS